MKRFWDKVNKHSGTYGDDDQYPTECWEWTAGLTGRGYGSFKYGGQSQQAHRVAWQLTCSDISLGLHVLHKCDNRKCVRLDHLFLGSHDDNMRDKAQKGRARNGGHRPIGENNGRAKLSEEDVLHIHALHKDGKTQSEIARQYSVRHTTIGRIVRGTTWDFLKNN